MSSTARFELGVALPSTGAHASPDAVARVAHAAEELSFDSVWAAEHLLVAEEAAERYGRVLDPLACLAWVAARVGRIALGTSVVLLPLRHPVHLAKEAATLQLLSGGRFRLGIGVGWHEPEFRFLGLPFAERGRRADEGVRLMRALWRGEREFEGDYWSFAGAYFGPLPEPPPPVWVGGASPAAFRRARRLDAVWHPNAITGEAIRWASKRWPEGRIVPRLRVGDQVSGEPASLADELRAYADAGMHGAVLSFGSDPQRILDGMRRFAREAMPRIAAASDVG